MPGTKLYLALAALIALLQQCGPVCTSMASSAVYASGERIYFPMVSGPLRAELGIQTRGIDVVFTFRLSDATGGKIMYLHGKAGQAKAPVVEVLDESGATVHRGTLRYG